MSDFKNTRTGSVASFNSMQKDLDRRAMSPGQYLHAINASLNTHKGDWGRIGNEPSNVRKAKIPYTYIGSIPTKDGNLVFSTNDTDSEIGLLVGGVYTTVNNSKLWGFKRSHPIIGVARENEDCSESAYWNDGLNPARFLNLSNIPFVKKLRPDPAGGCDIEEPTTTLDIEATRLTPLLSVPNFSLSATDGNLPSGAYRLAIAYSVKGVRVTEVLNVSNVQFLYHPTGVGGGINVELTGLDRDFPECELFLISTINQQTTYRRLGFYPTSQSRVYAGNIKQDDVTFALSEIPLLSVYYEGGDAMYSAGGVLIQTGVRSRPLFNYQEQALKIKAKWVAKAVPENYYQKGGKDIGYPKGETFPFFIRFVYNTGHRSHSTPLVGREASTMDKQRVVNQDSREFSPDGSEVQRWQIYDTSLISRIYPRSSQAEYIAMEGEFGYHESSEDYPDSEAYGDLGCTPIRHFRFPFNQMVPNWDATRDRLLILGVQFDNISYPLDENGNPIAGIVGYEILRGDREGNKVVQAKGVIFNAAEYTIPSGLNESVKGLYPNRPFNFLGTDPFLSRTPVKGGCSGTGYRSVGTYRRDIFTFHSPETHFSNPVLGDVLRVEAEYSGKVRGQFVPVHQHPKAKLIRDFALLVSTMVGIGEGVLAIRGKTTYTYHPSYTITAPGGVGTEIPIPMVSNLLGNLLGGVTSLFTAGALGNATATGREQETTAAANIPLPLRIANSIVLFSYYFGQGTNLALEVVKKIVPYQQYAYQYNSEGRYTQQTAPVLGQTVRNIKDYSYLYSSVQDFQGYRVNNHLGESSVILKLDTNLQDPRVKDTTKQTIGSLRIWDNPSQPVNADTSAYYVSIRRNDKAQWGQIDSVRIISTDCMVHPITEDEKVSSSVIFGGDTIIEEFTLKRKQHYFNQTAVGLNPDGFEFNYQLYPLLPYPRYWMDTHSYDLSAFFNVTNVRLPNDFHHLDRRRSDCNSKASFVVKNGYFYLYNAGVIRFFVESSYNLPFRENSTTDDRRKHYDRYFQTDLNSLFRSDVINEDNYFKIDTSLSPIKQLSFTYSETLPRDFSLSENKCFTYEPNKLIYSLPASLEAKKDGWRQFLTNNYTLFPREYGKISQIKEIARSGVLYLFENSAAKIHPGTAQLQTSEGTIRVSDGALFARKPENLSNSDSKLFTSCQSSFATISTPYGVYFPSQAQGKIFHYSDRMRDISPGIKFFLQEHLPSKLLKQFPSFEWYDNPVVGVGMMSAYDMDFETVYFCKRDYKLKEEFVALTSYLGGDQFQYKRHKFSLGDPRYFDDASFTLSYSPTANEGKGGWISFHDWYPDGVIGGEKHFYTFKDSYLWEHNNTTSSFTQFYGIDKGWEVHFPHTLQEVTTLENIEYELQCFVYRSADDAFHVLDHNFDRCAVWNTEQCSGNLRINMREYNRPSLILEYPRYTPSGVDVECTRQNQVYRINQFLDLTRNRGQFSLTQRPAFITRPNGYRSDLNTSNIDYAKPAGERTKFRHHSNTIMLRKNKSENVKMLLLLDKSFNVKSFR